MTTIIEPCCAERQLPALLREQKGRAVLFQTYGDVKLTAMTKAVSGMTGRGHRMTLAVPTVTKATLQFAAKGIRVGTMTALRLITRDDQTAILREALADLILSVTTDALAIDYALDSTLAFSLLMFDGPQGVVILQGDILQTVTPGLHLYAGQFATDPAALKSITATLDALFRARHIDLTPATTVVADSVSDNKKKSKTTKKTKTNEKPNQDMATEAPTEESK